MHELDWERLSACKTKDKAEDASEKIFIVCNDKTGVAKETIYGTIVRF